MNLVDENPRIALLIKQVNSLPVDDEYKSLLLDAIKNYREQILERPEIPIDGGWNDLEALQQVTLGDMLERSINLIP
ncbi:MAG: hypothetical protein HOP36_13495 [Methyloglobulus sp.]|jgi:hypothetical protein|nr:hypothetical protein [Methyloglobulus sp.]